MAQVGYQTVQAPQVQPQVAAPQNWFDQNAPPASSPSPAAPNTPAAPTSGDPMDPTYIKAQISAYVAQHQNDPNLDPSLINDPDYWVSKIQQTGGWSTAPNSPSGGSNAGYWTDKFGSARGQSAGDGSGSTTNLYNPNDLTAGFTQGFSAPTAAQAEATPGFQFEMQQGLLGVDRGAAAKGTLLTGGNEKALAGYAEGLASTNYQQTYQNALGEYLNAFNIFNTNQGNLFNRNLSLAQLGQTAAGSLNTAGTNASNIIGNSMTGVGSAQAAGTAGVTNAFSGLPSSVANVYSLYNQPGQAPPGGYSPYGPYSSGYTVPPPSNNPYTPINSPLNTAQS